MTADQDGPRDAGAPGLFAYMFVRYLVIDVLVGFSLASLWLLVYDTRALTGALLLSAGLFLLRFAAWVIVLRRSLSPITAWRQGRLDDTPALLALQRGLWQLPRRLTLVFTAGWGAYFGLLPLTLWFVFPEWVELGPAELPACALQVLAVSIGAHATYVQLTKVLLDDTLTVLDRDLAQRGVDGQQPVSSLMPRLIAIGVALILAPLFWFSSMAWLDTVAAARTQALTELRAEVELGLYDHAVPAGGAWVELGQLPTAPTVGATRMAGVDHRQARVWAAAERQGRWLLASRPVAVDPSRVIVTTALFCFAALVWALVTVSAQARAIMLPVLRLRDASRRLVEIGDVHAMRRVPVTDRDEVGDLTADFNRVFATHERLTAAAEAVAAGDLAFEVEGEGEVHEAFRRMIARLHEIVIQLRVTTLTLGAAIDDIDRATREQERATQRQIDEINQLEAAMRSLAGSASQIDTASADVLDIAERTQGNTDLLAGRIRNLGEHNAAIEQLLALIHEIAERSDLLALNGSLEATRAGEAGRGFALVAGEMRRLAERVTGIVDDMRTLVANIEHSGASAVEATSHARQLAHDTAGAARAITEETRRQSADTEHASANTARVADILVDSSAAIQQTRSIAEALEHQAQQLERALEGFRLREF